jgi:hypothetical protein
MKNMFFAHQACAQGTYIPDSRSDMYQVQIANTPNIQPFPDLFATPELDFFNPNTHGIGTHFFDNCTRQQIKSLPKGGQCPP